MISFFIPCLPARALSPNGAHGSYHAVAAARRELRELTWATVREQYASPPRFEFATVSVEYRRTSKKPRDGLYRPEDAPNAVSACKPVFDGLQDAGVLIDDDWRHMALGTFRIVPVEALTEEGIYITVE